MNVNINHPSFISFLENVSASILSNVTVNNYFSLTQDKKLGVQYMVLKLMKNAVKVRAKLTDNELRSFVSVLWKKNEECERSAPVAFDGDIVYQIWTLQRRNSCVGKNDYRTKRFDGLLCFTKYGYFEKRLMYVRRSD